MQRLPLFPLPVVLFPGAPLPLHIFEPRYRQMVAHCVEGDGRFGLLYHDPDRHGPFQGDPGQVGTVARILKYHPLADGRSVIFCRGLERFAIDDGVESGTAYYEAVVAPYDDVAESAADAGQRRASIELFHRVLREVDSPGDPPAVDVDREVAYRIAQAIQIDPAWKQRLLEMRSESERLEVIGILLRTVIDAHVRGPGTADE